MPSQNPAEHQEGDKHASSDEVKEVQQPGVRRSKRIVESAARRPAFTNDGSRPAESQLNTSVIEKNKTGPAVRVVSDLCFFH